jgi:hypothetical protein
MSYGWWFVVFVVGWVVLSVVTAPLIGRWLRRVGANYPEPPPVRRPTGWEPPEGSCAPDPPGRSST